MGETAITLSHHANTRGYRKRTGLGKGSAVDDVIGPAHPVRARLRAEYPSVFATVSLRGVRASAYSLWNWGTGRVSPQTGPDGRRDYRARLEARAYDTEGALVPRPIASVVMVPEWNSDKYLTNE